MPFNRIDVIAKYTHIVGKLHRTIIINKHKFMELEALQEKVTFVPLDKTKANPYLDHLEKVSNVLKENSNSYIVRHLHYNFSKDVEAFAEGRELLTLNFYLNYVE